MNKIIGFDYTELNRLIRAKYGTIKTMKNIKVVN